MTGTPRANTKAAFVLADAMRQLGVTRVFGLPGGGSSLDLIEGAKASGLPFTLVRHETAGVMMAAVTADLTGCPGAMLVTKGPGLANAANGLACAALERSPVLFVTDGFSDRMQGFVSHQVFDQLAMIAPVTKAQVRLKGPDVATEVARVALIAGTAPAGPVALEMTSPAAQAAAASATMPAIVAPPAADAVSLAAARALLGKARRPVVIAGLEVRDSAACAATRRLVAALGCPALVTYKAKGVIPDADPHFAGIFTGGEAEAAIVEHADLIILAGADPVEFILQPWRYTAPVLDIALFRRPVHYMEPAHVCVGAPDATIAALAEVATASSWHLPDIAAHRAQARAALAFPGSDAAIGPQRIVEMAAAACLRLGVDARASVDAGAHMISATEFWPCTRPHDLLISNGLATMGFALPAAIAAALHDPARPVLAFTGDGGLAMCLGELATAVAAGARIVVIVFNDDGLSMIAAKRGARDLPDDSLGWRHTDFATAMRGMGGAGWAVRSAADYAAALDAALALEGPALIDVHVDPAGYSEQLKALRG
ncbi:MAG: thiamine pyrophosphate-binding protein [Alphaproteobacteria bacterium]|nr:thiamine pyrophosphate-binding protein [Alphaproteobacteria bacterium]